MQYSKTVLFSIKPVFVPWIAFLSRIPLTIFMTVWSGGFIGGFSFAGLMGLKAMKIDLTPFIPAWLVFTLPALLAFIWIQFISVFQEKEKISKTDYYFFDDEVVIQENWWGINEKNIFYKNVAEISLSKNFIQQMYNIGTIKLILSSSSENNYIDIKDIPNPEEIYRQVKQLVQRAKEGK
jgi:hypothetical protein